MVPIGPRAFQMVCPPVCRGSETETRLRYIWIRMMCPAFVGDRKHY